MATPLRILIVDNSAPDADRILRALRRGGYEPAWRRVDTAGTLTAALSERTRGWDAVTCDDAMPQLRYLSALHIVRALKPRLPFILISNAADGVEVAEAARRNGCDMVKSDRLEELPNLIARAVHASLRV